MIVKIVAYVENFFVLPNELCVVRSLFARGLGIVVLFNQRRLKIKSLDTITLILKQGCRMSFFGLGFWSSKQLIKCHTKISNLRVGITKLKSRKFLITHAYLSNYFETITFRV